MQTGQLILILLLILVVAVVVVVLLRRRAAKREEQRVEAAALRIEAETIAARVTGLSTFAEQAQERAEVARVEAEEKAREAARLEAEAEAQRAAAEDTRREYEAAMRRADDVDPDVRESSFAPVGAVGEDEHEGADEPVAAADGDGSPTRVDEDGPADRVHPEPGDADEHGAATSPADDSTMSRAERREARESDPDAAVTGARAGVSPAVPAAMGGAAGAAAWSRLDDGDRDPESERIASAADYRDDVEPEQSPAHVYPAADQGTGQGMSDQSDIEPTRPTTDAAHDDDLSRDTESPRGEWGGPPKDHGADAGAEPAVDAGADTGADTGADAAVDAGADTGADTGADAAVDAGADTGADAGAGPADGAADADAGVGQGSDGDADLAIVAEPEDYAATEPVMAGDQTPPVEREPVAATETREQDATSADRVREGDEDISRDTSPHRDARDDVEGAQPVVIGDTDAYAATEPLSTGESTPGTRPDGLTDDPGGDDRAGREAYDGGADDRTGAHAPAETGAAVAEPDEGDRGATAVQEPAEERFDPTPTRDWAADEGQLLDENRERADRLADERNELGERDNPTASGLAGGTGGVAGDAQPAGGGASRRISDFHELRDGGFGVGSAAPLDDRAQPLDHPVQGFRESMTFRVPGDADYDSTEPDVWFYDVDAAERSGFRRSHG